jgi:hypothetical protein
MAAPIVLPTSAASADKTSSPALGFTAIPAHGSPLTHPTRGLVITTAGNLGVVMADGSDNDSQLIAVTAGMVFPFCVLSFSTSNTAAALGLN